MNPYPPQLPPVRIDFAAHTHLRLIVGKLKQSGLGITLQRYLSDLILSQPIPNGNSHPVATDPDRHYSIDDYVGHESEIPAKDLLTGSDKKVKP